MLSAFDLVPGPGLARHPDRPADWAVTEPRTAFTAAADLAPGWYRLVVRLRTPDRPAVRKRLELHADGRRLDAFEWNDRLRQSLILRFDEPVCELTVTLAHAAGTLWLDRFELKPVSAGRAAARAVRLKLKLLADYNCVGPVVARGVRLLAKGQVREFGRRVLKGLSDSRTMRIEVKRATEVSASWWRRRGPGPEQAAALRAEADAVPNPPTVLVLIPADPTRTDHARQTLLSVFRQAYPHWRAAVCWAGAKVPAELRAAVRWDDRAAVVARRTLGEGVRAALNDSDCDRVLVLPPDGELVEHGLLRFVQAGEASACRPPEVGAVRPAVLPIGDTRLSAEALAADTAAAVTRWAGGLVPQDVADVAEPLLLPFGGRRLTASVPRSTGRRLVLAADVRGLSGWDHVAFQVLRGLHSLGVEVRRHPAAQVYADLLPPGVRPEKLARTAADPQLVIAPPFLCGRFAPDAATAVLTMWEADSIPADLAARLSRSRVVVVPSRWGAECFRASGVTCPIEVVPLGYDPLVFHPVFLPSPGFAGEGSGVRVLGSGFQPRMGRQSIAQGVSPGSGGASQNPGLTPWAIDCRPFGAETQAPCVFGTAGALSAGGLRKNVGRVVELFRRAFPTEPDVRLRVKITPNCPPFDIPNDLRIDVLRATLPAAELAAWNRSLTAYVNASFAEGFGFHLLEAMACGRPLVSTAYSGPTAFFDETVGYVVPHRLIEADNAVYAGRWADPDDDALVAAMRRVHADRTEAARLGEASAARARRFTWRDCGRQLVAVLRRYELL